MDFVAALAQMKPKLGLLHENLERVVQEIKKAIAEEAHLVIFPELALTGYFLKDLVPEVALRLDSKEIALLKKLSQKISIAIGFIEASDDYRFYNSALYLEGGEIRHIHRKVYLPTYGLFDEHRYVARGEHFQAFDTKLGRMGLLICEDMWHLSAPYILAQDGAITIICISSSPGRGLSEKNQFTSTIAWQNLTSTTAVTLNSRVIFCNRAGFEDGIIFWGGSEVVSPTGTPTVRGKMFEEDFILATLDEASLRTARIHAPILRDENLHMTIRELHRIEGTRSY